MLTTRQAGLQHLNTTKEAQRPSENSCQHQFSVCFASSIMFRCQCLDVKCLARVDLVMLGFGESNNCRISAACTCSLSADAPYLLAG